MYTPNHFKPQSTESVENFIRQHAFAVLISQETGTPIATHLPLMLSETETGDKILQGHISRGNPQWKSIEGQRILCIFTQPHAYISSSWYGHINVPTWNYIAVHIYGKARLIEGEELFISLKKMVDHYETSSKKPFRIEDLPTDDLKKQMRGVAGLEINIEEIQASYKLSQNRNDTDFVNIIQQLEVQEDPLAGEIARHMKSLL